MFECEDCGRLFADEGAGLEGCPSCGGNLEPTKTCRICGEEFARKKLYGDVCELCLDSYRHDVELCYKIGAKATEKVEISYFLACLIDENQIESILFNWLKEHGKLDCHDFIFNDEYWFADRLIEEVNINENGKG